MPSQATGSFDVTLTPLPLADSGSPLLARMSIEKTFLGDLEGTSKGEMLSAGTAVKESAGYVAIERVTATLHGNAGEFVLQHSGTLDRGVGRLEVSVVPDSGTNELEGLTGTMVIDASHGYVFSYELPHLAR